MIVLLHGREVTLAPDITALIEEAAAGTPLSEGGKPYA